MLLKNSRYSQAKPFDPVDGEVIFEGLRPCAIGEAEGVVEHVLQAGERLDLLARHYYNDDRLWWRLVDANPQFIFAGAMVSADMAGEVILIPRAREQG